MITSTGVGVGSVGGIGMLRARRRDVSVKPNRKLDRKSSRGMIYENEELRLRTIQINAEVEQGQNDIKKLRRENEQLRREIWCLREEYDKLEDILKTQKTRDDSEGCSDEEEEEEDDDGEDDVSSGSEKKGELEDGQDESTDADEDDDEIHKAKLELTVSNELVKDEQFENAENQKLSVEKSNRGHHHMEFDQLSIVDEEEELVKREKKLTDMPEAKSNMQKDTGYTSGHAFNWIINPECGSIPSSKEQSLFCNSTQGISTMINSEGGQAQLLPPTSYIGWQRQVFEGDTDGHTFTTIDGHQTCAESIANGASCRMPRDTSACFSVFSGPLSLAKACEVNAAPSSSSENTSSTIIQKTSPDICVSGAVADHPSRAFGSSDQLLTSNNRDSLSKSYSCQELTKSFGSSMTQGLEAKSLPDNSTPRAFRSQLRVQLTKLPAEKPAEIPPKIPPLDWTLGKSYYGTCESLMRHLPSSDYQATSFESPTPRNLTLPPAAAVSFSTYSRLTRGERKFFPVWPNATASQQVNTQTQILCRKSNQSASPSASSSSAEHAEDKKDGKSVKPKKKPKKNKLAVSIRSSDNVKIGEDERPERSSSSGVESHRKSRKSNRISAGSKRRASSRSQSVSQVLNNTPDGLAKERGVGLTEQKMRRNSTSSESVPWCACWGNGCV